MRGLPLRAPGRYARRLFHDLRLEGAGRGREAAALGVGAFIGCLPIYGAHLLLVAAVGWLLGLNRLRLHVDDVGRADNVADAAACAFFQFDMFDHKAS